MSKLYADHFKAVLDAFSLVKPVLAAWSADRLRLLPHSPLTVLSAITRSMGGARQSNWR